MAKCSIGCNEHGLCRDSLCYCEIGWTGENCDKPIDESDGVGVWTALLLGLGFIFASMLIGLCYVGVIKRGGNDPEEYPLIR